MGGYGDLRCRTAAGVGLLEVLFWCVVTATLFVVQDARTGGPAYAFDSYQYLSGAKNVASGHGLTTSIIVFDIERRGATFPAPLTTFPPGYSVAIAGLSALGLEPARAGQLVSIVAFFAIIPLLAWGARALGLGRGLTRLAFVLFLASSLSWTYANSLTTESLFTAVITGALVALMAAEPASGDTKQRKHLLVLGCLLVGLAYWVRYAGLFIFAGVLAHGVLRAALERTRRSVTSLLYLSLPAFMIGALMLRNWLVCGSWRGGNEKVVFHSVGEVLKSFAVSVYHLLFGELVAVHPGLLEGAVALAALVLGGLAVRHLARGATAENRLLLPGVVVAVYLMAIIYAGITTVVSVGSRFLYPILPIVILLACHALDRLARAVAHPRLRAVVAASTAVLVVGYITINARSIQLLSAQAPHRQTEVQLDLPSRQGVPLRQWIDDHVPTSAVFVATNPHTTGHVLGRATVGLTESEYSAVSWSEAEVRALMNAYGAEHLILYPASRAPSVIVQSESAFLAGLLEGRLPPWLEIAAENREVRVFRRLDSKAALDIP